MIYGWSVYVKINFSINFMIETRTYHGLKCVCVLHERLEHAVWCVYGKCCKKIWTLIAVSARCTRQLSILWQCLICTNFFPSSSNRWCWCCCCYFSTVTFFSLSFCSCSLYRFLSIDRKKKQSLCCCIPFIHVFSLSSVFFFKRYRFNGNLTPFGHNIFQRHCSCRLNIFQIDIHAHLFTLPPRTSFSCFFSCNGSFFLCVLMNFF